MYIYFVRSATPPSAFYSHLHNVNIPFLKGYKKHKITAGSCLERRYVGALEGVCVCPILKRLIDTFT